MPSWPSNLKIDGIRLLATSTPLPEIRLLGLVMLVSRLHPDLIISFSISILSLSDHFIPRAIDT